jgi:hypothetical protein
VLAEKSRFHRGGGGASPFVLWMAFSCLRPCHDESRSGYHTKTREASSQAEQRVRGLPPSVHTTTGILRKTSLQREATEVGQRIEANKQKSKKPTQTEVGGRFHLESATGKLSADICLAQHVHNFSMLSAPIFLPSASLIGVERLEASTMWMAAIPEKGM